MNEESLFHQALKKPSAERAAFLDEACATDADLRRRVEVLLHAHDAPGELLAGAATTGYEPPEDVGSRIGPYKLLQKLGEGGMGSVFMAEQEEPIKRRVAVKIIKAGMDSAHVVARFEQERQVLALMDHPNIAKVLDAGTTPSGRPYFVMELVKGVPVTTYCDQEHLTPNERLELFIPVCQAVQHAHQKGIIHRDLKASNVIIALYDGKPVPKVIDFGVAKATQQKLTERTMFTEVGQIVGTLEYMAPEQAELNNLDVDTRADIYSLGALLYELLAGSPPFSRKQLHSAAFHEMLRLIREVEPPKPSTRLSSSAELPRIAANRKLEPKTLTRVVHGDLDWIVMKCLEKERARRYETANGLAMDVHRYLCDEPVLAGAPSRAYRARKFLRKHRPGVLAASAFAVLLFAGAAVCVWQAVRARQAEAQALTARDATEHLRQEAVVSETRARESAETERQARTVATQEQHRAEEQRVRAESAERAAKEEAAKAKRSAEEAKAVLGFFQAHVLASSRPEGQEGGLGKDVTIRRALDAAEPRIATSFQNQPLVEASIRNVLGLTYFYLGEPALAIQQLEQARLKRQTHLGPDHADTLTSMGNLAMAYRAAGKLDLAVPLFEQDLAVRKAKLGLHHPDTMTSMNNLAVAYRSAGKLELARQLFEQTLAASEVTLGADHPHTLTTMGNLAQVYLAEANFDLAVRVCEQTLTATKAKLGPDHPNTLASMHNLAAAYRGAGRLDLAVPLYEQTLAVKRTKLGPDHPETLKSMNNLAEAYEAAGKLDRALPLYEQTFAARKAKLGPDHPDTLISMGNLAAAYGAADNPERSRALLEQALDAFKAKLGPDHPHTLNTMRSLAHAYRDDGKLDLAIPLLEQTLATSKAKLGPDHPDSLASMNDLAVTYWSAKMLERSIPLFEETLRLRVAKLGADHPDTLITMANLAVNYRDAGRLKEAIALLEKALNQAKQRKPLSVGLAFVPRALAETYDRAGMVEQSEAIFRQLVEDARQQFGAEDKRTAGALAQLGRILLLHKKYNDAEPFLRECMAIRERKEPERWTTFNTKSMLGAALFGQKKYADAEPLLLQGYQGMKQREDSIEANAKGRLIDAVERLVQLYDAWGKNDESERWRKEMETRRGSQPHFKP